MRILLTGASGFIGHHVYSHLRKYEDLFCIGRREPFFVKEFCHVDILDRSQVKRVMKRFRPDVLIHLAWSVPHGKFWHSELNAVYSEASIRLFQAFLDYGGKHIISVGSCAEYPSSSVPVAEHDVVDVAELTSYGKEKRRVSDWLGYNADSFTWLRVFGIFGEGEDPRRLFPLVWEALKKGESFLPQDRGAFFDYINVADFGQKFSKLDRLFSLGSINVGTGRSASVGEYCRMLAEQYRLGSFSQMEEVKVPSINSRIPDCKKLMGCGHSFRLNFYANDFCDGLL